MAPLVSYKLDAGIASLTLCSPDNGNALSKTLLTELRQALQLVTAEPSCRVVTLAAQGPSFCCGLDLTTAFGDGYTLGRDVVQLAVDCLQLITGSPRPVVACVQGDATGGGVVLVAACDLVLAVPDAAFMLSEVIVGMIPALAAPLLLRRMTPGRFRAMALSSRAVRAVEAREYGLVDELAEDGLDTAVRRQLKRLLHSSPRALTETKRYLDALTTPDFGRQLKVAAERLLGWVEQPEVVAGILAFAEEGSPPWFPRATT